MTQKDLIQVPVSLQRKVGSGTLLLQISEKIMLQKTYSGPAYGEPLRVNIFTQSPPSRELIAHLEALGIECYPETWTPPLINHPNGFFLVKLPHSRFLDVMALKEVRKIDTAEKIAMPQNNSAAADIHADVVWNRGWDGTGVRIAILDSGLDTAPVHSDLPVSFDKMDYSDYPSLDSDVENTVTGHGTHVTGSVLGRGVLSLGNTGNGGGAYQGAAPDGGLVFLKIGRDDTGGALNSAMEAALDAAVNVYNADIITMSYGGWNDYHDGSESTEAKVDWCYSQGVPVFVSAGNEANAGRHYSGTVNAFGETGYIRIDVTGAGVNDTRLYLNLLWYDAASRNGLSVVYYDASYTEITDVTQLIATESSRGTESRISYYNQFLPVGSSTYYLKVQNPSGSSQLFHIYECMDQNGNVVFQNPDEAYTVSSPSTADFAFSVAAWTSRYSWTDYGGSGWTYGQTLNDICNFSSRGPRVDGFQKPDIAAPGSAVISMRDRDVYSVPSAFWVDNDGTLGGDADYYVMQGTSMACPVSAGAAALLLDRNPAMTPSDVYSAIKNNAGSDAFTGTVPNSTWGYGKLDINAAIGGVLAEIKVFLQGPYSTTHNEMMSDLKDCGYLPLTSPYSEDPRTVSAIPENITDWVLVELRSTPTGATVTSKSVFLHKDGRITADDGVTGQITLDAVPGDYYLVVRHRNHLGVMSQPAVSLSSTGSVLYDFSTGTGQYYGSEASLVDTDPANVYGMYGADVNGDGVVLLASELNLIRQGNLHTGYLNSDVNLNGAVSLASELTLTRANSLRISQIPAN